LCYPCRDYRLFWCYQYKTDPPEQLLIASPSTGKSDQERRRPLTSALCEQITAYLISCGNLSEELAKDYEAVVLKDVDQIERETDASITETNIKSIEDLKSFIRKHYSLVRNSPDYLLSNLLSPSLAPQSPPPTCFDGQFSARKNASKSTAATWNHLLRFVGLPAETQKLDVPPTLKTNTTPSVKPQSAPVVKGE